MPRGKSGKKKKKEATPRISPRHLEARLNVDMGCTPQEIERRTKIRALVKLAVDQDLGWTKVQERMSKIPNAPQQRTFERFKGMVREHKGDVMVMTFQKGRTPNATIGLQVQLAKQVVDAHARGEEMDEREMKKELQKALPGTYVTTRHVKTLQAALRKKAGIRLSVVDSSTVSQTRENYDVRNPVGHAAGYKAFVTLDDGTQVISYLRFCLDFTGVGVKLSKKAKTFTPNDSSLSRSRTATGSDLMTNMKLVCCDACGCVCW
jgi:hypothetical protein